MLIPCQETVSATVLVAMAIAKLVRRATTSGFDYI